MPVTVPPILHGGTPAVIYFGALIGAVIQFLLVAIVVYFALVVPINYVKNRAAARKAAGQPPNVVEANPTVPQLFRETPRIAAGSPLTPEVT